jgi:hypothetical protein
MGQPAASPAQTRQPVLLFLHIPKAAGTSLDHVIRRQVRPDRQSLRLREFVTHRLSTELDNGQTRLLAAHDARPLPHPSGELTPGALDTALRHLEQHGVVAGLAEHVPQAERATARLELWLRGYTASQALYGRVRRAVPPGLKRLAAHWRT